MTGLKIAWIGAGKMGLPVCQRLKAAGHDVRILARRPEQAGKLAKLGFAVESAVPALIGGVDVVFTCVPDDTALAGVIVNDAFKAALPASAVLIDMSTVSPSISARIATHLGNDTAYLRSPVSGSTMMAEAGTLTALVSGPRDAFDAMSEVFSAFTKTAFHLGPAEQARFLKLAINSMVAATSALLGEALAFGLKGGLTNESMLEVITQSVVASPLIGYKKNTIISGDYTPAATLDMLKKDVDLFLSSGEDLGMPLPIGEKVKQLYEAAASRGLGGKDFFVLVQDAARMSSSPAT